MDGGKERPPAPRGSFYFVPESRSEELVSLGLEEEVLPRAPHEPGPPEQDG